MKSGVACAQGEILVFTDDDAIADRRWVASIHEATHKQQRIAFGGRVIPTCDHPLPAWFDFSSPYCRHFIGGAIGCHNKGDEARDYDEGMWVPVGCNMFFRREVFDRYGLFRTDMGLLGETYQVGEDCEFCLRSKTAGEPILYWPEAVVYHSVSPHKFSKESLLQYSWQASQATAKMANLSLTLERRAKEVLKTMPAAVDNGAYYVLNVIRNQPQAKLYYLCQLVEVASRAHYFLTTRKGPAFPAE